jgi:capsular exopolysaccharide synthesis family protein
VTAPIPPNLLPPPGGRRPKATSGDPEQAELVFRLRRLRDTALRLKWLLLAVVILATGGGVLASRLIAPEYEVRGTIYIAPDSRARGAIREGEVLADQSWADLVKSFRVLDTVVARKHLHVNVATPSDEPLFAGFRTTERPSIGGYILRIAPDGRSYALLDGEEGELEKGTLPDSIGRSRGFQWWVEPQEATQKPRDVRFSVLRPRDVSIFLREALVTILPERGQLLTVALRGSNGRRTAETLDGILTEFVTVAGELRRSQVSELATLLRDQLTAAETRLRTAESALQQFRADAITMPGDGSSIYSGIGSDPSVREYFDRRVSLDNARRDRVALQAVVADASSLTVEALVSVPAIADTPGPLRDAVQELGQKEAALRAARQVYSEEFSTVRELVAQVNTLRRETIPRLAQARIEALQSREGDLERTVEGIAGQIRRIPQRMIDETRLRREFAVADQFYTSLLTRWNEVRLVSESISPDVQILDRPETPSFPSSNTAPRIAFLGFAGGVGLAFLIAFLFDRTDRRLRYPEEAQNELGIEIIAHIPAMPRETRRDADALAAAQAVEAFRTLRLRLQHDAGTDGPVMVVITSAGSGEGKSLIAANLAGSFADAGVRTVLVDGDLRRGMQHATYGCEQTPGVTDVLMGSLPLQDALRETRLPNLTLLPAGRRHRRVPELLQRQNVEEMLASLRGRFDAIIIDSAPLAAGIDAFALGVAAGRSILVMRQSVTDRRLAAAKLEVLDRLPIRLIGGVLNDVPTRGREGAYYSAYSYLPEYAMLEGEAPAAVLPAPRK